MYGNVYSVEDSSLIPERDSFSAMPIIDDDASDSGFSQWIVTNAEANPIHVHHLYYVMDKLPWEYPHDALTSLCASCHESLHQREHVRIYLSESDLENENDAGLTPCKRCAGSGWLPYYSHVEGGVCFRCNGNRFDEMM
jgi:hypothetical protein